MATSAEARVRLPSGSNLPHDIAIRVHEAVAVLQAKKLAIEAGVPSTEVEAYDWKLETCSALDAAA